MLIVVATYDTDDNGRSEYTKQTISSLYDTVDWDKNRLIVVDNGSTSIQTISILKKLEDNGKRVIINNTNLGTACAINLGMRERAENEIVCKLDNDVTFQINGWADEMEGVIYSNKNIGVLGLKRDDVYGDFTKDGNLLWCDDIIGTCTAFNPMLMEKIGYMSQPSIYGFDDVNYSVRSISAGFKNAFLPHIKITHLDDGKNPYCDWKRKEAGFYLQEVSISCNMIKQGKISYYYDGGFND